MKVVVPREFPRVRETAALPLIPAVEDETGRRKMSFKLYTDPANEASPKVTVTMFVLTGGESLREHLVWRENLDKVIRGLNLDTPLKKDGTISQLVVGAASTSYQKGIKDSLDSLWSVQQEEAAQAVRGAIAGREIRAQAAQAAVPRPELREQDITAGLQNIIRDRCPYQVLETQKRFMRRNMRKPGDVTTRTYVNYLTRINDQELPLLPPFNINQALNEYEIKDIIHNGLPPSWKAEMIRQGFDPLLNPLEQLVHFCERLEATEHAEPRSATATRVVQTTNVAKKPPKKAHVGKHAKWCEVHHSNSHNTKDCWAIKNGQARVEGKPRTFAHKKWERGSNSKPTNSGDLNAVVQKSQDQLKKIRKDLQSLTLNGTKRGEMNVVEENRPTSMDPTDVITQVDMLISELTKAQEATEQDTTPGSHDSDDSMTTE